MKRQFKLKEFAEKLFDASQDFPEFFETFKNWMCVHGELEVEDPAHNTETWRFGNDLVSFTLQRFANTMTEGGWAYFVKFNENGSTDEWFHHEYDK